MKFTLQDRSNYLRGLLILIGKDRKIAKEEREIFIKLSSELGFSKEFCEEAINELLENEYIIEEPPKFSNENIAKIFIKDGIRIAFVDKEFHLYELNWLRSVAHANFIDNEWALEEFEKFRTDYSANGEFEITKYLNSFVIQGA